MRQSLRVGSLCMVLDKKRGRCWDAIIKKIGDDDGKEAYLAAVLYGNGASGGKAQHLPATLRGCGIGARQPDYIYRLQWEPQGRTALRGCGLPEDAKQRTFGATARALPWGSRGAKRDHPGGYKWLQHKEWGALLYSSAMQYLCTPDHQCGDQNCLLRSYISGCIGGAAL